MWLGGPKPEKVGLKRPHIKEGRIAVRYAFRGALKAQISGGEFEGLYAFYGAKEPLIKGGMFTADLCFYASENARVEGGRFSARSAFMGSQSTFIRQGEFSGPWALCESRQATLAGGEFSGPEVLREAISARVEGGIFGGSEFGTLSRSITVLGGAFSGEGFLRGSQQALVLGGAITGPAAFEQAEAIRVLVEGEITEVRTPKSGVIAATRIGRIIMDGEPGDDLKIMAEEVGEGRRTRPHSAPGHPAPAGRRYIGRSRRLEGGGRVGRPETGPGGLENHKDWGKPFLFREKKGFSPVPFPKEKQRRFHSFRANCLHRAIARRGN